MPALTRLTRLPACHRRPPLLAGGAGGALDPGARWRPILRSLLAALRKQAAEVDEAREAARAAATRAHALEDEVGRGEWVWRGRV